MNQKILLEIKSIATEIQNSSNIDTSELKEKVSKLYDKLVVLSFLENSIADIEDIDTEISAENNEDVYEEETINESNSTVLLKSEETDEEIEEEKIEETTPSDKTIRETVLEKNINNSNSSSKSSLHEELKKSTIQIGLNDRIAFVKRLFDGNQQDFHRVLSQVNTFSTIDEVREFIDTMVKPEHNWDAQEEYAERFMEIIELKFQ